MDYFASPAHAYPDLVSAVSGLKKVAGHIKQYGTGLPKEVGPLVIGVTGGGAVASGAMHVIDGLHDVLTWVKPSELAALEKDFSPYKVYATQIMPEDIYERLDGGAFDLNDYFAQGAKAYKCVFAQKVYFAGS